MSGQEISFLKAFNAKEMPDSEVARSFVSSEKFSTLAGNWNALILGPRGSGKTTLLKMLRLPALRLWKGDEAEKYRASIKFTGIFVPADITWSEMMGALGRKKIPAEKQAIIVQSLFCTNVLLSVVEAFETRITPTANTNNSHYRCAKYEYSQLKIAIDTICELWQLRPKMLSLLGMKAALQSRLLLIQSEVAKHVKRQAIDFEELENVLPFLHLSPMSAVEVAVNQFDTAIEDADGKWALLFDEFEIAPSEIQDMVFRRFRSAGKKVFYKVGLAPCTSHTMNSLALIPEASVGNDYQEIKLWYPEKKSALEFSERLFVSIRTGSIGASMPGQNPKAIFGENHYVVEDEDDIDEKNAQPYGKGILWKNVFESLSKKDSVFKNYLAHKKINPANLDTSPNSLNGNTIRKIAPLVAFRDAFRREESGTKTAKRGRKKLNFAYSGWEAISAICEGNPRWLIGVTNMMMASEQIGSTTVKPSKQVDKIQEATESFSSMLSMVPIESRGFKTNEPIDRLLRQIGEYFFARIVQDNFVEEPPLSFKVDDKVSSDVQAALRIAINHGAIINIPDSSDESSGFETLDGKRFRLAYLLSPRFRLPLRATKAISLSTILEHAKQTAQPQKMLSNNKQIELL